MGLWPHIFLLVQERVCWYTRGVYDGDRTERVALRVSLVEKELWVRAAGGSRRLSDWIRDRLNAAVTGEVDVGDRRLGGDGQSLGVESTVVAANVAGELPSPVTAATCPAKENHHPGRKCLKCQTTFPPERVFRGPDPRVRK